MKLADFPPHLLALITRLIDVEDLVCLVTLTGDHLLATKCVRYGGINDLHVVYTRLSSFSRSFGLDRLLARNALLLGNLTHISVCSSVDSVTWVRNQVRTASWLALLPKSMISIKVQHELGWPLFNRPLSDSDDPLFDTSAPIMGLRQWNWTSTSLI